MVEEADEEGGTAGRSARKLQAALTELGGAERIAGAKVIDVGPSAAELTGFLLEHGAGHVTAIDAGQGQLHARLGGDARVICLEKTNLKIVSLRIAPGLFDFFVVDVSSVASRTMLRPLSFRLRPGAEGIILVKPKYEIPEGHAHDGEVKSQGLRAWALHRMKKKGEELGFELLGSIDAPGPSAAPELLTRWRFNGRVEKPAHAPEPKKPAEVQKPRAKPATKPPVKPAMKPASKEASTRPPKPYAADNRKRSRSTRPPKPAVEPQAQPAPQQASPAVSAPRSPTPPSADNPKGRWRNRPDRPQSAAAKPEPRKHVKPAPYDQVPPHPSRKPRPHSGPPEARKPARATERLPFEVPRMEPRPQPVGPRSKPRR